MSENKKDRLSIHDSHDSPGSGNQHGPKQPDSMRRRSLIKASVAAVPTVLTLRSGLVSAASMDCRHKDEAVTGVPEVIPATDHDSWLRAEAVEYSGYNLVAFATEPPDKAIATALREKIADYDDAAALADVATTTFCGLSEADQNQKIADWGWSSNIQRYQGAFLHVTNTDQWYVWNDISKMYDDFPGSEKNHITFCNMENATKTQSLVLVYVSFTEEGHIDLTNIRHYPDSAENNQQITESCACSIDPMFQMPDG